MSNNDQRKVKVNIDKDLMRSQYSDYAIISQNYLGFHFDFGQRVPGSQEVSLFARVALSPQHAKLLYRLLEKNIEKYEDNFGEIKLPEGKKQDPSSDNDSLVHFTN